jgi:uncharacterized membrane protein
VVFFSLAGICDSGGGSVEQGAEVVRCDGRQWEVVEGGGRTKDRQCGNAKYQQTTFAHHAESAETGSI